MIEQWSIEIFIQNTVLNKLAVLLFHYNLRAPVVTFLVNKNVQVHDSGPLVNINIYIINK